MAETLEIPPGYNLNYFCVNLYNGCDNCRHQCNDRNKSFDEKLKITIEKQKREDDLSWRKYTE